MEERWRSRGEAGGGYGVAQDAPRMAVGVSVQLRNVTKTFSEVVAVDRLSLSITKNEFLTFLGPSGSGKTSTLLMIAGLEAPSSGDITFDDVSVTAVPAYKRGVGVVFQNYALFPHMTVYENIAFPLRMRRIESNEIKQRVERALELVKLEGLEGRQPKQLSGGQQQRVALARAIVFGPGLLLMDEPLGALDRKLRQEMQLEIRSLHRKLGTTIVYVTHDQEEALTLSDRVVLMRDGGIEQVGTPAELYERPRSRFVADFIGESSFLEGNVSVVEEHCCVVVTKGGLKLRTLSRREMQSGQRVVLSMRPEHVSLVPSNFSSEECDAFDGVVEDTLYCGDVLKFRVSISKEDGWVIGKVPNRAGSPEVGRGGSVRIAWNWKEIKLFV